MIIIIFTPFQIGKSLFDEKGAETVKAIVAKAKQNNVNLLLPVDFITASKICWDVDTDTATVTSGIPSDFMVS